MFTSLSPVFWTHFFNGPFSGRALDPIYTNENDAGIPAGVQDDEQTGEKFNQTRPVAPVTWREEAIEVLKNVVIRSSSRKDGGLVANATTRCRHTISWMSPTRVGYHGSFSLTRGAIIGDAATRPSSYDGWTPEIS
jgi:hypothetical protein